MPQPAQKTLYLITPRNWHIRNAIVTQHTCPVWASLQKISDQAEVQTRLKYRRFRKEGNKL